jgi:hypothetical protein
MTHISKITGRSYQIVNGEDIAKNQSYDIKIIMDWDDNTDEVPFIINFYFGEYTYEKTEYYIEKYSKETSQIKLLKQKLDDIILEDAWNSENLQTKEKVRALFTAICHLDDIIADTKPCDDYLWHLYHLGDLYKNDVDWFEFQDFMVGLIV